MNPSPSRYSNPEFYRPCGRSGLKLPAISLGLWQNFGEVDSYENGRQIVLGAFDRGITHFDLANNYGPPPGSAEKAFGRMLKNDLAPYRDELIISTKAGHEMWPGPYGDGGSRKNLLASLDQSLGRMGLEYVDIFYSHRFDPTTPLEETMGALSHAVRCGKALYVGVSKYSPEQTAQAAAILKANGTPCLIHQPRYNFLNRQLEEGLSSLLSREGIGCIAFGPLAQGLCSERYLSGIPSDARAAKGNGFLRPEHVTAEVIARMQQLQEIARQRGQKLSQMAIAWVLRDPVVTTALIGASKLSQLEENLQAVASVENLRFSQEELAAIDKVLGHHTV